LKVELRLQAFQQKPRITTVTKGYGCTQQQTPHLVAFHIYLLWSGCCGCPSTTAWSNFYLVHSTPTCTSGLCLHNIRLPWAKRNSILSDAISIGSFRNEPVGAFAHLP
ncbi:unnamed protein product, partial [Ectocarpus sp. 12 AP-2014]